MRSSTLTLLIALALPLAASAQEPEPEPPSITYGKSRTSKKTVLIGEKLGVLVDDGVEWQGVTVYLSMTSDLVAVDTKTEKTIWHQSVGAFWNQVGFEQVMHQGKKVWAVVLSPGPDEEQGADRRRLHLLRTGEDVTPQAKPAGKPLTPRKQWKGADCSFKQPTFRVIATKEAWQDTLEKMLKDPPKEFHTVDFNKELVLLVCDGDSGNCFGIEVAEAYEGPNRIQVRLRHLYYQTINSWDEGRPWGLIVLPRRPGATYVVERNAQRYVNGPPLWKVILRRELKKER